MLVRSAQVIPRRLAPVALGALLMWLGDSQTDGRETGYTKSPVHAILAILQRSLFPGNMATPYTLLDSEAVFRSGRSGESLAQTLAVYEAADENADRTFVHFQESGNQNLAGQTTAEAFRATVYAMVNAILLRTPNAIILSETAFNFGRGPAPISPAEDYREWEPTYNNVLREVFASYGKPNQLFIAETDYYIKAVQAIVGASNVWFPRGDANEFHYKALGNLVVALAYLKALRYPIRNLCLDLIPTSEVSQSYRDIAVGVVA